MNIGGGKASVPVDPEDKPGVPTAADAYPGPTGAATFSVPDDMGGAGVAGAAFGAGGFISTAGAAGGTAGIAAVAAFNSVPALIAASNCFTAFVHSLTLVTVTAFCALVSFFCSNNLVAHCFIKSSMRNRTSLQEVWASLLPPASCHTQFVKLL